MNQERRRKWERTLAFQNTTEPLVDFMVSRQENQKLMDYLQVHTERELLDAVGSDFFYVPGRDISQNEGFLPYYKHSLPMDDTHRTCPLGIRWLRRAYDSKFSVDEAVEGPFQSEDVTAQDILNFPWPKASDFDFSGMVGECEKNADRITIGGLWTGLMGDCYRMMGFQNFLLNTALQPELVDTLISRMAEMYLELNDSIFRQLKGKLDIWFFGNDLGSQSSLLISGEMIERFFFRHFKQLCDLAHSYGIHVMMHSCGCIGEIIPMLVRAGVEILDPIQVTAKGMDPQTLAREQGGKIVFHGGVDTQQVLPFGTTEQVRQHALEVTRTLAATGGYIFSGSQILGEDIPCENVMEMYKAINQYKKEMGGNNI
ncbi:MAG: uroporphyrinogen decarboxylase family protein [Eubacteriales bacterium]|jgi:uroporphyrinogen decarboxylase